MVSSVQQPYLSPQAYLDWEPLQCDRYEYIDGEVYAMVGGTLPHSEIAVNLTALLKNHLRGKGCRVLGSNDRGKWELTPYAQGDDIYLSSVDLRFPMEQLYDDVDLAESPTAESSLA